MSKEDNIVTTTFRTLVETAERKFARVRDVPLHPYGGGSSQQNGHFFHKVFKAYMRLWKYQQENRAKLVNSGLQRWEIGEIASRIGQLYFNQYLRTSEARFLLEAYIFYEAIIKRNYFEGSSEDRGVRFKELRFYARFLMVSLILNRAETVKLLVEKFKDLVEDSKAKFRSLPEYWRRSTLNSLRSLNQRIERIAMIIVSFIFGTNFKEWRLVVQEIFRFTKADTATAHVRPLRYCAMFDSHPTSLPYVSKFHAKRLLKFQDAVLTSYHKNEVKFAELTLDTFRMLQCLEWEPSGSFYQKQSVELAEARTHTDHSVTSGLIDINLVAGMTDPNLPPNPKKAVLYRPSVTQLLAVIATVCEELPTESVILIYLSAAGNSGRVSTSEIESSGVSRKFSKPNAKSLNHHEQNKCQCENHVTPKGNLSQYFEEYLWLGPCRNGDSNTFYPCDIIPFTRRPLFLIIDSDNSHGFKILHGAERGEPAALFLSPTKPSFKNRSENDMARNGSQFTFFLTAPLQAFCQLVDYNFSSDGADMYKDAQGVISAAFTEWEVILCTSTSLDLVWAQLLSDPFLRRLILRFIFCRAVLALFCLRESGDQYLPVCVPELPDSVASFSKAVQPSIKRLANHLKVAECFNFHDD